MRELVCACIVALFRMRVFECICANMCFTDLDFVCMCVCVCVREREREGGRERERERERARGREDCREEEKFRTRSVQRTQTPPCL